MLDLMTANAACAKAAALARVEVVAAYPITPQTTISEKLAEMVARFQCALVHRDDYDTY